MLFFMLAWVAAFPLKVLMFPLHFLRRPGRILLIPEFGEFGGTRTYFKCLVRFYKEEGKDVLVALDHRIADKDVIQFLDRCNCRYTTFNLERMVIGPRKLRIAAVYAMRFFVSVLLCIKERPSMILVSTGQFVFLSVFLLPVRVLYILHVYPDRMLFSLERGFLRYALSRGKRILTVSRFARAAVLKYWLDNSQHGAHTAVLFPVQYSWFDAKPEQPEVSRSRTVLTLGHVAWTKDPETWMKTARLVAARHNEVEFVWAGAGYLTDEYLSACRARMADEPRIRFVGLEKNPDGLYETCSVYFQPSVVESYGLSVAEAMRRGIPCVVSDAGGLAELIDSGKTGIVVPAGNAEQMADAIIQLLLEPDTRRSMGLAAQAYFEAHASLDLWKQNMRSLTAEMLGAS